MSEKFKLFYLDPLSARMFANDMEGGASKSLTSAKSILARVRDAKRKNQKAIENAVQNKNVALRNMPLDKQRKIYEKFKDAKSILGKTENTIKNIIKKNKFDN